MRSRGGFSPCGVSHLPLLDAIVQIVYYSYKKQEYTMATLVFLIDVDNTLLNNDKVKKDFDAHLQAELGPELTQHFWELYEQVRHEKGVIDIPDTLRRLRQEVPLEKMDEQTYEHVVSIFE